MPSRTVRPNVQTLLSAARVRVHERLARAIEFPVLVACAPAGFGKSTVVREFLATRRQPYRHLPLACGQADLLGFMGAFADCLGDLVPALQTSFMAVHDRLHGATGAAAQIAAWVAGHLEPIELTVVIDGLEHIADERIFAFLTGLVDRTARCGMRWVLVGHAADHFPIARWLADDRMDVPLDEGDFALTEEDLATAFDGAHAPIPRHLLRGLCGTVAANWPAAIALALNDGGMVPIAGSDGEQRPYASFAKRAFDARSESERRFLLETCVYEHFDTELLAAAGWEHAQTMLARLCSAGAFLFAERAGAYRYHDVFRSFLEDQLRAGPADRYRRIRTSAALVSRRVGRWPDALELYIGLAAATPLAELLSEHGFAMIDRGQAALVYRGLGALRDAEFARFPVVLAVKASLESLFGSFDVAEAWFRHALETADAPRDRGAIVFRFATDLVRRERRDAIEVLEPIIAAGGHDLALTVSLAGLLATAYATHHQLDRAAATIERALAHLTEVSDPGIRAKLYFQAGYVAFFGRDPARAKGYARQAVEAALASHLYDVAARALSILYNIAIDYEDDVRAGGRYLEQLAACSIKAGSRQLLSYAKLGQFEIEVMRGNLRESAQLDQALNVLEIEYSVLASETLLPAQALRATWTGEFARAYGLLATTAEQQITLVRQAQRHAEIALYAAAAGLLVEADIAVHAAIAAAVKSESTERSVAFTNAYVALALILLGRHRQAARVLSDLRRSGSLTPRLDVVIRAIRTVNDRWQHGRYSTDLRDVLRELDAADFGGIGRLIEALPLPQSFRARFAELDIPERLILAQLSAGRQAGEIAASSARGAQSVHAHIGTLCRKLGCSNPRQAVALARSAGVLHVRLANAG